MTAMGTSPNSIQFNSDSVIQFPAAIIHPSIAKRIYPGYLLGSAMLGWALHVYLPVPITKLRLLLTTPLLVYPKALPRTLQRTLFSFGTPSPVSQTS